MPTTMIVAAVKGMCLINLRKQQEEKHQRINRSWHICHLICMCVCACVFIHIHAHTQVCVCAYMFRSIYTHTHTIRKKISKHLYITMLQMT